MGRIVVTEFVTLDGVFEDPAGGESFEHGGWAFAFNRSEDGDRFKFEELMASDAQLLGRVTYEGFAKAWPAMGQDEFGAKMNSMPKFVVSSTLTSEQATWENSTVIGAEPFERVQELKDGVAGDVLVAGSARLAAGLAEHGLIDEYRLMVFPIVLGAGRRLFEAPSPRFSLRLTEQRRLGTEGICLLRYEPIAT